MTVAYRYYEITAKAGRLVAGQKRGAVGSTIRLTADEARYELLVGSIVDPDNPEPPQPPPAIAGTDTLDLRQADGLTPFTATQFATFVGAFGIALITGLEEALDGKIDVADGIGIGSVAGLANALAAKATPADISSAITVVANALAAHAGATNNPHVVTKAQVGLANAVNLAPADYPISTAVAAALAAKATPADISAAIAQLTAGSPAELDTFLEAYNRFLSNESAQATLTTQLAGKLAIANNLSEIAGGGAPAQKAARANLGGSKSYDYGDISQVLPSDARRAFLTASLTAQRTWTLPAGSGFNKGEAFRFTDAAGGLSQAFPMVLAGAGSDTINGAVSKSYSAAFSDIEFVWDGTSKWTTDVQGLGRGGTGATDAAGARTNLGLGSIATQAAGGVSITGGAADGLSLGPVTAGPAKVTTLSTSGVANFALVSGNGYMRATGGGNASTCGYLEFLTGDGIRRGYIGFASSTNIELKTENSWGLVLGGNPISVNAALTLSSTLKLASYTLGTAPTGAVCQLIYISNGRKSGELMGAGTGVVAYFSNGSWRRFSDDSAVTA